MGWLADWHAWHPQRLMMSCTYLQQDQPSDNSFLLWKLNLFFTTIPPLPFPFPNFRLHSRAFPPATGKGKKVKRGCGGMCLLLLMLLCLNAVEQTKHLHSKHPYLMAERLTDKNESKWKIWKFMFKLPLTVCHFLSMKNVRKGVGGSGCRCVCVCVKGYVLISWK